MAPDNIAGEIVKHRRLESDEIEPAAEDRTRSFAVSTHLFVLLDETLREMHARFPRKNCRLDVADFE